MSSQDSNLQLDSDFTAQQYSPPLLPSITNISGTSTGGAVTTINADSGSGAVGPIVTLSGGSTGFSFTAVGTSITMTGAAPTSGLTILDSTILNLNTNTKQTLYTVPVGKSAIVTELSLRSASVDLSGGATTSLSAGFDAGATDWGNPFFGIVSLTSSGLFVVINQFFVGSGGNGPSVIGTAGQTFGAITDVAFGSAATVVIDVIGYEFP